MNFFGREIRYKSNNKFLMAKMSGTTTNNWNSAIGKTFKISLILIIIIIDCIKGFTHVDARSLL